MTTKAILTDPLAIQALEKALRSVNVFKYAESYCRVSVCVCACVCVCGVLNMLLSYFSAVTPTGWSPSTQRQLLTYLPKCIHFGTTMFCMRLCDGLLVHMVCRLLSLQLNHHIAERELPARRHVQQDGARYEPEDTHKSARLQDFTFCGLSVVSLHGEEPRGYEVESLYVLLSHFVIVIDHWRRRRRMAMGTTATWRTTLVALTTMKTSLLMINYYVIPYSGLISGIIFFVKSANWPSEVIFVV